MPIDSELILTTYAEICAVLGVARTTLIAYLREGCPGAPGKEGSGAGGQFPVAKMVRWCRENKWEKKAEQASGELEDEKLRIDIATKKLKYRQLAGELVDREAVTAEVEQVVNVVRGRLEAIPQELAMGLPVDQQPDFIQSGKQRIGLVLRELAALGDGSRGVTGRGERSGCDERLGCA